MTSFSPGSPIAAVTRIPNHIDLFVTAWGALGGGRICSTSWEANVPTHGGWTAWLEVTGGDAPPSPLQTSGVIVERSSPITAFSLNPGHLQLFVTGDDELIYSTWWQESAGWANWFNVSGGRAARGSPITAVSVNPRHLSLFVTGTDGLIYSTTWDASAGWRNNWFNLSGITAEPGSPITAVSLNPRHLQLFVTGDDERIYSTWWEATAVPPWANWFHVSGGGAPPGSPITAVSLNPSHLQLFVTGDGGRIYSTWWEASAGWANWFHVSGGIAERGSRVEAIKYRPDHLQIFVTGTDGLIYSTWWDASGGWHDWFNVSGGRAPLGSPITAVSLNPDHLQLFVTVEVTHPVAGKIGRIYSTWWEASAGWANWFDVPAPDFWSSRHLFYDPLAGQGEFYGHDARGGLALLKRHSGWRSSWKQIIGGLFGGPGTLGPNPPPFRRGSLLFYTADLAGTGEFYTIDEDYDIAHLSTHTNWRSTWTHIIPGKFSPSQYTDLLFYDSAGTVEFYTTHGQGEIAHLSTHTGLPSTWTHIIPGNFSPSESTEDLLFYDGAGTVEFRATDGQGGMTHLSTHTPGWRSTWTHIVKLGTRTGATHLLFYDSAGTGEFWATDGQGGMTHVSTHTDWSATWKQIVPVSVNVDFGGGLASVTGLLFYDDVGTLEIYTYDGQGGISLLSQYTGWRSSWKIII